ncbi:MAG: hypothetical protein U0556_15850 [Dehalococcoidia bacterium]
MDELGARRWIWLVVALAVAAVMCVCLTAAGLAVIQAGGPSRIVAGRATPTATSVRAPASPTVTPVAERLQLVGTPLVGRGAGPASGPGSVQVSGLVRNPESIVRSAILTATLFDAGGRVIGTAVGSALNIQSNDSKPYTLFGDAKGETVSRVQVGIASRLPASPLAGETSISFAGATARADGSGFLIETRAINSDKTAHRMTVVGILLDGAGNLVGIARGTASLPAGGSATVTLTSPDRLPTYQTIRVQVDVLDG